MPNLCKEHTVNARGSLHWKSAETEGLMDDNKHTSFPSQLCGVGRGLHNQRALAGTETPGMCTHLNHLFYHEYVIYQYTLSNLP